MIEVARFINSRFTSNTYIISNTKSEDIWIVDPGDFTPVQAWMKENSKSIIAGVLITHAHFDHIYGANEVYYNYPFTHFFVYNRIGFDILHDAKMNGSKYTEVPFELDKKANVNIINARVTLWNNVYADCIYTPGHSEDSMCIKLGKYIFTGDTLIKDIRTVTKLKGGNADELPKSINKIKLYAGSGLFVCPGHGECFQLDNYDLNKAINKRI